MPSRAGFSLLELLLVLGILSLLSGLGFSAVQVIQRHLGHAESATLFAELETACRLYRLEHGDWPDGLRGGEVDLNGEGEKWQTALAPYLESIDPEKPLEDGFGNPSLFLVLDGDHDRRIQATDFRALPAASRPDGLRRRVALYSLDGQGRLASANWPRKGGR